MNIGFSGEVRDAVCPCHKGQFVVLVRAVLADHEADGSVIAHEFFPTKDEAETNLEPVTKRVADEVLAAAGITDEDIGLVQVATGDGAEELASTIRDFKAGVIGTVH